MSPIDGTFAQDFLHRLYAAVNNHDAEAVAALCCDEVVWEDPAASHTLHGRSAVLQFHRDVMFPALPDAHVEPIDGPYLSLDGMGVAVRLRIKAAVDRAASAPPGFAPTNSPVIFETAEFSRFEHGRLAHHVVVLNMLDMARQIGAVPSDGTVGAHFGLWLQHMTAFWARARER